MPESVLRTLFSSKGRVGRLAYFLGSVGLSAAFIGLSLCKQMLAGGRPNPAWFALPMIAAWLWGLVCLGIKRCRDLGRSGFLLLLLVIPVVNVIGVLLLLFAPGKPDVNPSGGAPLPSPASGAS